MEKPRKYTIFYKNNSMPNNKMVQGTFDEIMNHLKTEFGDVSMSLINKTITIQ